VTVVGDFDSAQAMQLVQQYSAVCQGGEAGAADIPKEPEQTLERRATIQENGPCRRSSSPIT